MRFIARHTIAFGRVLTLVFLFVSSSFITVLHFCAKKASECCDTSGVSDHNAGTNKQLPLLVAGLSVHNVIDCYRNAVVSYFSVFRALVEIDSEKQNVEVRSLLTSTFDSSEPSNTLSWSNYSYSDSVSLPSVEKYVLNATLLI